LKVDIKKLLTHAIRTIVITGGLIFTRDSYAKRSLTIVAASVHPSVSNTAVFC